MSLTLSITNASEHHLTLSSPSKPTQTIAPRTTYRAALATTLRLDALATTVLDVRTLRAKLPTQSTASWTHLPSAATLSPIATPLGPRTLYIRYRSAELPISVMPDLTVAPPALPTPLSVRARASPPSISVDGMLLARGPGLHVAHLGADTGAVISVANYTNRRQAALADFLNLLPPGSIVVLAGNIRPNPRVQRAVQRLGAHSDGYYCLVGQIGGNAVCSNSGQLEQSFSLPIVLSPAYAPQDVIGGEILGGSTIDALHLATLSAGADDGNRAELFVDDRDVFSFAYRQSRDARGVKVAVVSESTGRLVGLESFDVHRHARHRHAFADFIMALPPGRVVLLAARRNVAGMDERCIKAIESLGSRFVRKIRFRDSWSMIGQVGAAPGSVREEYRPARSGAVSLKAQLPLQLSSPVVICVRSAGINFGNVAQLRIGGSIVPEFPNKDGLNVAIITPEGAVAHLQTFDTMHQRNASSEFSSWVQDMPYGTCVAVAVKNDAAKMLTVRAHDALRALGAKLADAISSQDSYALIGFKGAAVGTVSEQLNASDSCQTVHNLVPETISEVTTTANEDHSHGFSVSMSSTGSSPKGMAHIAIDGVTFGAASVGLNVAVIDPTSGVVSAVYSFNTCESTEAADDLAELIEQLPLGQLVAMTVLSDGSRRLSDRCKRAISTLGSRYVHEIKYQWSWVLLGRKGSAPGSAHEYHVRKGDGSLGFSTWVPMSDGDQISSIDITAEVDRLDTEKPGAIIKANGNALGKKARGVIIAAFDERTGALREYKTYDVYFHPDQSAEVIPLVHCPHSGFIIAIAVQDDPNRKLPGPRTANGKLSTPGSRSSWTFVGRIEDLKNAGIAMIATGESSRCRACYRLFPKRLHANMAYSYVSLRSSGRGSALLAVQGAVLNLPEKPSIHVAVLECNGEVKSLESFDVEEGTSELFADMIETLDYSTVVAVAASGGVINQLEDRGRRALRVLGSLLVDNLASGGAWALVGSVGNAPGASAEVMLMEGVVTLSANLPFARVEAGEKRVARKSSKDVWRMLWTLRGALLMRWGYLFAA